MCLCVEDFFYGDEDCFDAPALSRQIKYCSGWNVEQMNLGLSGHKSYYESLSLIGFYLPGGFNFFFGYLLEFVVTILEKLMSKGQGYWVGNKLQKENSYGR